MKITIMKIKTILLLIAICSFQQSLTFATEDEKAAMEVDETGKRGMKHLRDGSKTADSNPICIFDYLDNDSLEKTIFIYLDFKKDQSAILYLLASNRRMFDFFDQKYTQANEAERHYQWQDNTVSARGVYFFNSCMRRALGLYNNVWFQCAEDRDVIRFERLYSQLRKSPYFAQTSLPIIYVDLLRLDIVCAMHTLRQTPGVQMIMDQLHAQRTTCQGVFAELLVGSGTFSQNEGALYLHFIQCVLKNNFNEILSIRSQPRFGLLNNSLMDVLNQTLWSLKLTPGLNSTAQFAVIWQHIIVLEPTPTIWQLGQAAESITNCVWDRNTGWNLNGEKYLAKAAEYREEQLKAIIAAGQNPTDTDYSHVIDAYISAERCGSNGSFESGKYVARAAACLEMQLKANIAAGQTPSAAAYHRLGNNFEEAGNKTQGVSDKLVFQSKAVEYYVKEAQAIMAVERDLTFYDHEEIACAYSKAAMNADDVNGSKYLALANEYYEKQAKAIMARASAPNERNYRLMAGACSNVAQATQDAKVKVKYWVMFAELLKERAKHLAHIGRHQRTLYTYIIADAYCEAGKVEGIAEDKLRYLCIAREHFEEYIKAFNIELKIEIKNPPSPSDNFTDTITWDMWPVDYAEKRAFKYLPVDSVPGICTYKLDALTRINEIDTLISNVAKDNLYKDCT